MPWCPKCGAEYRDGFTRCASCDVPLVDRLTDEQSKAVFYDNMAVMRSAKAAGMAEDAAADEPLDFKTIKLQYNVQAKFVLE